MLRIGRSYCGSQVDCAISFAKVVMPAENPFERIVGVRKNLADDGRSIDVKGTSSKMSSGQRLEYGSRSEVLRYG